MTIGIFSGWSISRILDKFSTSHVARNDEWNSDRPKEDGSKYDGPAGMEPDGVIDSNWDEVTTDYFEKDTNNCRSHGSDPLIFGYKSSPFEDIMN